jgi:hypothetical protein
VSDIQKWIQHKAKEQVISPIDQKHGKIQAGLYSHAYNNID